MTHQNIIHPQAPEEIAVTAHFWYECPATLPSTSQSHAVHRDLMQLLSSETDKTARCTAVTITGFSGEQNIERQPACAAKDQAQAVFNAIADCYADQPQVTAHLIENALSDLRHLCDLHGLDFGAVDKSAYRAYLEQRELQR